MSSALGREKDLPDIPVDVDTSGTVEDEGSQSTTCLKIATLANTNKALPSINAERTLSEAEMSRLHELWNGAGLSARAHRRRRHGHNHTPAPISIPRPEDISPKLVASSADLSITSATPPATGTQKRWGFLSARLSNETRETEKKAPNALEKLRSMAQDRLKKKLRYAKSAPNLGNQVVSGHTATFQPAVPVPVEAGPKDIRAASRSPREPTRSPDKSTRPEVVPQPENMDENAIYFTVDSNWRVSQRSVEFEAITRVPDSPTSSGRPDSPLLHRHFSLDQLSFAALRVIETLTETEFPEIYPRDEVLHPIDELHAYLEL